MPSIYEEVQATKSSPLAPVWVMRESKFPSESKMTRSAPGEPPVKTLKLDRIGYSYQGPLVGNENPS